MLLRASTAAVCKGFRGFRLLRGFRGLRVFSRAGSLFIGIVICFFQQPVATHHSTWAESPIEFMS